MCIYRCICKSAFGQKKHEFAEKIDGKFVLESVYAEELRGCMVTLILTSNNKIWIHIKDGTTI